MRALLSALPLRIAGTPIGNYGRYKAHVMIICVFDVYEAHVMIVYSMQLIPNTVPVQRRIFECANQKTRRRWNYVRATRGQQRLPV